MSRFGWFDVTARLVPAAIPDALNGRDNLMQMALGTTLVAPDATRRIEYVEQARIPKRRWLPLTRELRTVALVSRSGTRPRCGLFALENSLFEELKYITTEYPPERNEREGIPTHLFNNVVEYLDRHFKAMEPSIVHGATWDSPGLDTVTVNHQIGRLLGLHLDSWDGITFSERDQSRTRLCVNIGPEFRSFIFVPIRLRDAAVAVVRAQGGHRDPDVCDVIPDFLSLFSNFPVFRLNVPPGMGYFADTDNLIHDGSSLLAKRPSLHFTVRGRYAVL